MKSLTSGLILFTFVLSAWAEVVVWNPCPIPTGVTPSSNCTINEVRVDPCAEAADGKPCRIKKGHRASISFDFTPNFSSDSLQQHAYWLNQGGELGFPGMKVNACNSTTCPTTANQKQTYSYQLLMSRKYPVRTYEIKWLLSNAEQQECCFTFHIKLHN